MNRQPLTVLGFHEHLAYLEGLPDSCAQLRWMATNGIEFETVAPTILVVPKGHGPLLSQDHTHLYWPTGNRVLMTKKLSPDASVCTTAQGPVCGLAATGHGVFVITGKQDDAQWHVEFADLGQAETRRLASFDRPLRAPLCLVSFAGDLFFTCDEKLYRCDSGARA